MAVPVNPSPPDWYGILGVDPSASDADIGRAFRRLARRFHPDVGRDSSDAAFSDVARAWEVLGNPSRRADYDRARSGMPSGGIRIPVRRWTAEANGSASVVASGAVEPPLQEPEVTVSLAESVTGTVADLRLPGASVCASCSGTGQTSGGACRACGGQGRHRRQSGSITVNRVCQDCDGTGARPPRRCTVCEGRGWSENARQLSVRIPAGVADGTRLRLRGASGEPSGFARVRVAPDPWFTWEGRDLVLRVPLGVAEAALGTELVAQLPDGPAQITVPPGTGSGARLRVPGRGAPGSRRGDLVAAVEIVWPREINEAERAALEGLAAVERSPRTNWPTAELGTSEGGAAQCHAEPTKDQKGDIRVDDAI